MTWNMFIGSITIQLHIYFWGYWFIFPLYAPQFVKIFQSSGQAGFAQHCVTENQNSARNIQRM